MINGLPLECTFSPLRRRLMIAGAVGWMATVQFYLAQAIAGAAATGYSLWRDDISLLGISSCAQFADARTHAAIALCSPRHGLFNVSLALVGALIFAGAVLTRPFWGCARKAGAGIGMIAVGGLGALVAGIWPVDANAMMHSFGASLNFTVGKVGLFLLGWAMVHERRRLGLAAMAVAVVNLAAVGLYVRADALGLPSGALERLAVWPETAWFFAAGYVALGALLNGWGMGAEERM